MKWFQVDSDTPDDPKIKAVIRRGLAGATWVAGSPSGGQAAAGALLLLWCYVANHGGGDPGVGVGSDGEPLPLNEMADELLFDSQADLERFLDFLAEKRHIDPDAWTRRLVVLPAMSKRADAYARSKGRAKSTPVQEAPAATKPARAKRAKPGEKSPGLSLTVQTVPTAPTDQEHQLTLQPSVPAGPTPADLVALWNRLRTQGPKVQQITDARAKAYAAALKAQPDLKVWDAVIRWVETQPWCNAKGTGAHATWRLDLDHLAQPGKLQRAKERMDGDKPTTSRATGRVAATPGKYANAGGPDEP